MQYEFQPAYAVPETPEDEATRERAAAFISRVAVSSCVESPTDVSPIESLYEAVQRAEYDAEARQMVETNARTDVIERTMKSGHIMSVDLMVDENGKIRQFGQSMDSVQANSLRYAATSKQMRQRVEAETRNAFRIEEKYHAGELEGKSFVVLSRAADDMTKTEMDQAGFFTETMSCAIQVTTVKNGRLVTESAFVSGVAAKGEARHDQITTTKLAAALGIDIAGKSAAEVIDTPFIVDNTIIPNGATDLVALYDECADGTFFGETQPRQDYLAYRDTCAEREARFAPKVDTIIRRLISESRNITSPVMATQRLHKISEEEMVAQAIGDTDIRPEVFGAAASYIRQARVAYQAGDAAALNQYWRQAVATAESSSCPGAPNGSQETESSSGSSDGDCEFVSKECPLCHKKNVRTRVTKTHISGDCGCTKSK